MPPRSPRRVGSRSWGGRCARGAAVAAVVWTAVAAGGAGAAETAADVSARLLLDQLDERQMPDVTLWVLDRVAADPKASPELKKEVPFRRAIALVGIGRTEADAKKRAAQFDEAEKQIDEFLKTGPTGSRAIDAYTQKGNLLIERGRAKLEQAKRPGVDAKPLKAEAATFFDAAIKALQGTVKPDEKLPESVVNAEDAVIREFRDVRKRIADIKAGDPKPKEGAKAPKVVRRPAAVEKELERLEADEAALQVKLVQTRLMVAGAYFEKSKAFDPGGADWMKTLDESTRRFKELADKYPTKGGGVFARYYEGRNVALQGLTEYVALAGPDPAKADPKKVEPAATKIDRASTTLAELTMLEDRSPLAIMLRAKALGTSLECWLARAQFDKFDANLRKFALTPAKDLPGKRLDDDWQALKYRAAVLLDRWATSPAVKDKTAIKVMQRDALRLATEVAAADKDFASEARALAAKLGKELPDAAGEKTFEAVVAEAKVALATMQEQQAEAKKLQAGGKDAAAALAKAGEARDSALVKFEEALAFAEGGKEDPAVTDAALNYARYMRTYLLYDAKRYAESADLGALLVEQFPNAMGSRQAGMIAMASLQQLSRAADAAAAEAAKGKLQALAASIAKVWPSEKEGGEALGILVSTAIESRNPKAIVELVDALPADAGGRSLLLGRAGAALWREVLEQGRAAASGRPSADVLAGWKKKARAYLDEALEGPPGTGTALRAAAAAALARAQIALDDGDAATAVTILENPGYGPWTLANDPKADPSLRGGSFAEAALTVSLRGFILAQSLDKAQQAMDRLESLAGEGDDKSDRLTAMYYSMGRELQEQLERLGSGEAAGTPAAAQQAAGILGGFEKFLDGLAKRDPRVSSQIWVATTYLSLGSGKGTGAVVPKAKAEQYLDRAAGVYAGLLEKKDDPDVEKYEASIRLKIANILRERGKWDEAQSHVDWILSDAKRQNSLETQWQAAELLQQAGLALAQSDAAKAGSLLREATAGRTGDATVIWGWGGIANKLSRPAFAGSDDKALEARRKFFEARYNVAACLLARAELPGSSGAAAKEVLGKAETAISMTRKLYPDLGGEASAARFEKLLKDVQKLQGSATPRGFAELDERNAAPAEVN